jgi:hypothetical protein
LRILSLSFQLTGMALLPPALLFGLLYEHGMRLEMTLLAVGSILFVIGRWLEPGVHP